MHKVMLYKVKSRVDLFDRCKLGNSIYMNLEMNWTGRMEGSQVNLEKGYWRPDGALIGLIEIRYCFLGHAYTYSKLI